MKKWNVSSNNSGVSEVIGTILLLGISVALFSVIYVSVLSVPSAPSTPSSNIAFSLNETSLILTHSGGEPLGLDSKVKITVDDNSYTYNIADGLNPEAKQDNYWGFGEQFIVNFSKIGITEDMYDYAVGVSVIDVHSNSIVMSGTKFISNNPPIIGSPFPYNISINVPIHISQLNIAISDPDNDAFQWSIETNPNIGHASGSMQVHTEEDFNCSVTTILTTITVYIWYVNATDINGKSTNHTYTFITGCNIEHKDAIDSDASDVDLSIDKGIETNFAAAQANTTDTIVMTIQEADYGNQDNKTIVQGNTTNRDDSADLGTETNFINCKENAPDSDNMSLVETYTGLPEVNEHLYAQNCTNTSKNWKWTGGRVPLSSIGGGNIRNNSDKDVRRWFAMTDTSSTGNGLTVVLSIYVAEQGGDDNVKWGLDTSGDDTPEYSGTFTAPTAGKWTSATVTGLTTTTGVNAARLSLTYDKTGGTSSYITVDAAQLNVTRTSTMNYRLDVEYNWSTAHFSEQTKELCFYVQRHTGGIENLMVKYRTGSTWNWLGNITTVGWTNLTAIGLTSGTYTIRLNGSKATNDVVQDTWNIDCIFLHTYNGSNYKIDFEYQWIHANYSDANEQVCMYITSTTGTETLNVNYRNGAVWTNLGTIIGTGLVTIPATGLSSSTYTIQLIGTIESYDTTRDTWTIDCLYLHTWT